MPRSQRNGRAVELEPQSYRRLQRSRGLHFDCRRCPRSPDDERVISPARAIVFVPAVLLTGCVTMSTEHALPSQSLDTPSRPGTTRVIFYNEATGGMGSGAGRIGIRIDGKGVAALPSGQYVQMDLT